MSAWDQAQRIAREYRKHGYHVTLQRSWANGRPLPHTKTLEGEFQIYVWDNCGGRNDVGEWVTANILGGVFVSPHSVRFDDLINGARTGLPCLVPAHLEAA